MTEKHLADRWQVSLKTLRRWRLDNEGPVSHKLFRHVRYHEADVIEFERRSAQHLMTLLGINREFRPYDEEIGEGLDSEAHSPESQASRPGQRRPGDVSDAVARWRRADGNLPALDAGAPGPEEAGRHAAGRAAGIPGRGSARAAGARDGADTPLMRALGLAHHWQRLLDEGRFSSMTEIAAAEGIDLGQASKMSRLARLAPT